MKPRRTFSGSTPVGLLTRPAMRVMRTRLILFTEVLWFVEAHAENRE
jgi:hypothetical protein